MSDDEPIDYEAVRRRFPWVGLGATGEHNLSVRYREAMAERLSVTSVATTDAKFIGLAQGDSRITPLAWPFQENDI